jgi:hypothetical protein
VKRRIFGIAVSLLVSNMVWAPQMVLACAFDSQPYFTYTNHPDLPLGPYAKGDLGVVEGTFARSYLCVAYRYFAGKPLSAQEQQDVVSMWNDRLQATDFSCAIDVDPWLKERVLVPGTAKLESIDTAKPVNKDEPWQTFCNCQSDAFSTASKTLQGLITKYGATSAAVKDWLKAQDEVFGNCGENPYSQEKKTTVIPGPLPLAADPALQQQRAYQIAAANFYAQNYDVARQQFEKIAADPASPWRTIAGYLAVRTMIRASSLSGDKTGQLLRQASEELVKMAADPSYATLHDSVAALQSFIAARLMPERHLAILASESFTGHNLGELTKSIDNVVNASGGTDGTGLDFPKQPAALRANDMIDWITTYQSDDKAATQHAIDEWKKTHSLPWLVAATAAVDAASPDAPAILAAAAAETSQAAKWTLFYHVNRIKLDKGGKEAEVRDALDKVINNPPADLPTGALNEFKTQRLELSRNLAEFVRFGVQKPLCVCSNGGTEQVPDDVGSIVSSGKPESTNPMFTPEAGGVVDNKLPLSEFKPLVSVAALPASLKNDIAWPGWVRAILVGDDAAARELAPLVKTFDKAKGPLVDAYLAAATPEERKFAAVNLMMHYSSAQPNPEWGPMNEDGYGDAAGWWWSDKPVIGKIQVGYDSGSTVEEFEPLFLTPAQQAQAKAQIAKLEKVEGAPNYFAKVVFAYQKTHPADPRVPEALHWLVKSTHYGASDDATHTFSKQAFTMLHTKYKTSPWTKKTPYYY